MKRLMKRLKLIIPALLIAIMILIVFFQPENITAEKSDGYFEFNDNIAVTIKNGKKPKEIFQKLEIVNKEGEKVPYISNIINNEKIVISPIEKTKGDVSIKNLDSYSTEIYDGVIYVDNEWNLEQISNALYKDYFTPYDNRLFEMNDMAEGAIEYTKAEDGSVEKKSSDQKLDGMGSGEEDYSTTNLQEKNVDEADIVKTDGNYIYYISRDTLYVVKNTNGKMEKLSEINDIPYTRDMYLKGDKLVLVGEEESKNPNEYKPVTSVVVYDIKDRNNLKKIGSTYISGYNSSTRLIGDNLYVITGDSFNLIYDENEKKDNNAKIRGDVIWPPHVGKPSLDPKSVNLKKLIYFPSNPDSQISRITSYNISNSTRKDSQYMGYQDLLYMSEKNAYVSYTKYTPMGGNYFDYKLSTTIVRFTLNNGDIKYSGNAEVEGTLLNQFSLSEANDTLFVAYNSRTDKVQDNSVSSFDENLVNIGNITGIASGERIYSTRFAGNMLYMVTFKDVDPLFAIDISNPTNMKTLGYLKMPGYSTYLHPYKDGKLIGFGQDTKVNKYGNTINDGFKMALFDMSNPLDIKILDEVLLGDRGSSSPLEYDHKAIMTDLKNDIIGFPMKITKSEMQVDSKGNTFEDYKIIFNGALVYKIQDNKFKLDGKISHVEKGQDPDNSYEDTVQRIIYIGDKYITMSSDEIKSVSRKSYDTVDLLRLNAKKEKEYITMD